MAVDEALLESHVREEAGCAATLRLYGWQPAALSLGRAQPARYDATFLREQGLGLVRRPTGGLAVLHDAERTYAVCAALRRDPFPGGVVDTYRRVAEALEAGLQALGVAARAVGSQPSRRETSGACFGLQSVHEIALDGRKLVGSAQLRRGGAFLQHGSIVMRADPQRTARALGAQGRPAAIADLEGALGRLPAAAEIDEALVGAFEARLGARFEIGDLSARERERATRLYAWKYCSLAWTLDGRFGLREERWGPSLV